MALVRRPARAAENSQAPMRRTFGRFAYDGRAILRVGSGAKQRERGGERHNKGRRRASHYHVERVTGLDRERVDRVQPTRFTNTRVESVKG